MKRNEAILMLAAACIAATVDVQSHASALWFAQAREHVADRLLP